MRTATVSTNQIEFDLFNLPLVTIPALPAFIPQVVPAGFRWVSQPDFEAVSPRQKLADNLEALRLLKLLREAQRPATAEEQGILARYNGWGGLALVFEPNPREWTNEAAELKSLLTEAEYASARATVTTAFYTPYGVTKAIYQGLEQVGFRGGRVLEPAAGTGIFLAAQPQDWKVDWHPITCHV